MSLPFYDKPCNICCAGACYTHNVALFQHFTYTGFQHYYARVTSTGALESVLNLSLHHPLLAMHFQSFDDVIVALKKKKRPANLLLGNGFSMAYDKKIFSYNALAGFIQNLNDETLTAIFSVLKTNNFELIMQQLSNFSKILSAIGAEEQIQALMNEAHEKLKLSLLDAIKSLHPEHVFKVPEEKMVACAAFLKKFIDSSGKIYSTNYDLLLYWVLMRQNIAGSGDGFGRELENAIEVSQGSTAELSELRWGPNISSQNIFYLHGALPFFDTGTQIIKEQYDDEGYLLENIGTRLDAGEYPIFVTAGEGNEKLANIRHNRYLSDCYDHLCKVDGSVITFGFSFGPYDEHIIDALNKAAHADHKNPPKLWSIYIGVYSDADLQHIESIKGKFHAKIHTFDAETANVWGHD